MRVIPTALLLLASVAQAQQVPPHPATLIPPAQPPIVLPPLAPPAAAIDPKTGKPEPQKLCTRTVFVPCADERSRTCTRKETVVCD